MLLVWIVGVLLLSKGITLTSPGTTPEILVFEAKKNINVDLSKSYLANVLVLLVVNNEIII